MPSGNEAPSIQDDVFEEMKGLMEPLGSTRSGWVMFSVERCVSHVWKLVVVVHELAGEVIVIDINNL